MSPDARITLLITEPAQQVRPARLAARAEHDLRRVLGAGELHQRAGDVGAGDLVVLAAELLEQLAVARSSASPVGAAQPVGRPHVHAEQLAAGARRHARRPPDHVVAAGRAGDRDDHALARLPRSGDAVRLAVLLERLVDPVGDPHQRELAQRAEVALPEVVGERGVDLLRRVDVAVRHAPAQRLGRHVDELDLVGGRARPRRGSSPLLDAGDLLDDVVHRLEVLDVDASR